MSGLLLIAGNLTWFTVHVDGAAIEVQGQTAVPPLSGLALASVALAGALSLAPLVLRIVLACLQIVLGIVAAAAVLPAITDPAGASAPVVTEATGIDGDRSVRAVIDAVDATAWPVLALAAALIGALLGVLVLITARSWPRPGRRYANTDAAADPGAETAGASSENDWDALSRGDDPTTRSG